MRLMGIARFLAGEGSFRSMAEMHAHDEAGQLLMTAVQSPLMGGQSLNLLEGFQPVIMYDHDQGGRAHSRRLAALFEVI